MASMGLEAYLAIQQPALSNYGQIVRQDAFVWVEDIFTIWSSTAIHPFEELSDRLLIIDALLHVTRSKVNLVGKLR